MKSTKKDSTSDDNPGLLVDTPPSANLNGKTETVKEDVAEAVQAASPPQKSPPSEKSWWKKVNIGLPFFANNKPVRFEPLAGNIGIIALDTVNDADTIAALEDASRAHRGGVVQIDAEIAADLKKNHPFSPFERRSQPTVRVWETQQRRVLKPESGNVAAANRSPVVAASHGGAAPTVVGGAVVGAGKPSATAFTPHLQRKSEGKGPVLRAPSTGVFKEGVPPPI